MCYLLPCFHRKYPSIRSEEERDQYKAVFNDQYAEYKELHIEVQAMATKFDEMDEMIQNLSSRPSSQMVQISLNSTSLGPLKSYQLFIQSTDDRVKKNMYVIKLNQPQ